MLSLKIKHSFTIIEILVAIALLSLLSVFVSSNSLKLIRNHEKTTAIKQIEEELFFAKQLAIHYQATVFVDISMENGNLVLRRNCFQSPKAPKIYFKETVIKKVKTLHPQRIAFHSSGYVYPFSFDLYFYKHNNPISLSDQIFIDR